MTASRLGERRVARFTPTRTDDLRPDALALIGEVREWHFAWVMDEGPYDGQAVWIPSHEAEDPWIGWAPDEDLTDEVPA